VASVSKNQVLNQAAQNQAFGGRGEEWS